ncbi:MAG: sulfite exporter TauE/SafE family protein [Gemmatimonadales bacterium]|nr:sulfite exporter TauE/SafE family protein [Gemmatimonadales bacterium]
MPETIFSTLMEFLITCGVLVVAQLVYVLFGFGSGLIAVGSLALLFPEIQDVVVLLLLANLPAELMVVWKSRSEIKWRPIAGLGVGIGLGIPAGAWILTTSDPRFVLTILGGFLVLVGIVFLRLPTGGRLHPPAWVAAPTGLVSGLLTGLFGTGGPPLIIWYHLSADSKAAFRGNLMTIFLLMAFVRIPSYAAAGLITAPRMWSTVAVLPALFLGAWFGNRLHLSVSESRFRLFVSVLLASLGAMLLVRNLMPA